MIQENIALARKILHSSPTRTICFLACIILNGSQYYIKMFSQYCSIGTILISCPSVLIRVHQVKSHIVACTDKECAHAYMLHPVCLRHSQQKWSKEHAIQATNDRFLTGIVELTVN